MSEWEYLGEIERLKAKLAEALTSLTQAAYDVDRLEAELAAERTKVAKLVEAGDRMAAALPRTLQHEHSTAKLWAAAKASELKVKHER